MPIPNKTDRLNIDLTADHTNELRRERLIAALQAANGAWRDEDHPELATAEDMNAWIAEGRSRWIRTFDEE